MQAELGARIGVVKLGYPEASADRLWLSTKGIDPAEIRDNDLEILPKQKNSGVSAGRGLYSAANFV